MSFEFYKHESDWQPSDKEVSAATTERIRNFGKVAILSKTYE